MTRSSVRRVVAAVFVGTVAGHAYAEAAADAGFGEETRQKATLHLRVYNGQPKEAYVACRGQRSNVPCSYVVTPVGTTYVQRIEGSCWAPESAQQLPRVCR
jgi:hypothetical protein